MNNNRSPYRTPAEVEDVEILPIIISDPYRMPAKIEDAETSNNGRDQVIEAVATLVKYAQMIEQQKNNSSPIKSNLLDCVSNSIACCTSCDLCNSRKNTVPGSGDANANLVIFGEAPGVNEDEQGLPFVGRAGKLLNNMLKSINLTRDDVYILNSIKCRPPQNRKPLPAELKQCEKWWQMQLEVIKPRVILALGGTAAETLCGAGPGVTKRRGQWENYLGIPVMISYHPAYLLRNPAAKGEAWNDWQEAKKRLEE